MSDHNNTSGNTNNKYFNRAHLLLNPAVKTLKIWTVQSSQFLFCWELAQQKVGVVAKAKSSGWGSIMRKGLGMGASMADLGI